MERETYYLPVYDIRDWAGIHTALTDIIHCIVEKRKIEIYESEENAWEEANDRLCDDDTCNVVEISFANHNVSLKCRKISEEYQRFSYYGDFKKDWCNIIKKRPTKSKIVTEIVEDVKDNLYKGHVVLETKKRKIKQPALKALNECADLTEDDYPSDETFEHDDDCIRLLPYVLRS